MPNRDLPTFEYHPSPFTSGAIQASASACACCGESPGSLYLGPVYCRDEVDGICPWCIADGTAAAKWDAEFTDAVFVDEWGDRVELPNELVDEVLCRTPGVVGAMQSISWWAHCERPAAFLRIEDENVMFRCLECGKTHEYVDLD